MSDAPDLWEQHDREWRDPAQVASGRRDATRVDRELLRLRARGAFWDILEELDVCLLVGREYEHLLVALALVDGRPHVSYLPLPHPSGIAVDRTPGSERVFVASTRNPNQVYEFRPADDPQRPLVPVAAAFYPGGLYLHDLAFVGGRLHANAVGQNAVVCLDGSGGYERVWWPKCIERDGGPEFRLNHIQLNSIAAGSTLAGSYFTASADELTRRRPGHVSFPVDRRGVIFSGRTREPVVRGLTRPHSARLHEGRLWVDDSGYGEVGVTRDGQFEAVARLPGWTRGLALNGQVAFVATSRVLPRFRGYAPGLDVHASTCGVHAIDAGSGKVIGSVTWPVGNQIFGVEWLPREATLGWPFVAGRRRERRARDLFYSFRT